MLVVLYYDPRNLLPLQLSNFCILQTRHCATNGQVKNDLNRNNVSNLLLTKITVKICTHAVWIRDLLITSPLSRMEPFLWRPCPLPDTCEFPRLHGGRSTVWG